jgi:polar amino acid transport system substrate-binding protein
VDKNPQTGSFDCRPAGCGCNLAVMSVVATLRSSVCGLLLLVAGPLPATAADPAPASAATVARVPVNDAPPYRIIGSANGAPTYSGIYVDVLREIAASTGLTLEFVELPFARGFRVMQEGEADIMLGPNRSPDREVYLHYLEPPLPQEPKVFLQAVGAAPIRGYDDLAGRRIAVLRGAGYFDRFDADTALSKTPLDDYTAGLRLVAVGRLDTVVIPELQALWLLRETGFPLQVAPWRVPGRPSYIAVSRRSPLIDRVPQLEAALQRVVTGDGLRRILQRYE